MILLEDNNTVLSTQSRNHLCKLDQEMSPFNRPLVLYLERQSSHKLKLVIADIDKGTLKVSTLQFLRSICF